MVSSEPSSPARLIAKLVIAVGASLGLTAALAAAALGYWTAPGSGAGTASAGTISPPTITSAVPGAGTVALTWSSVTPPGTGSVAYYVTRGGSPAGGTCPTVSAPATTLTCTDSGLTAGTYAYTVTAVWRTWSATSTPAKQVTLASGALSQLALSAATATPTAGAADSLTITAVDAQGRTVASYTGSHTLTFSGASSIGGNTPTVANAAGSPVNFGTGTAISFTAGVASVSGASNGVMRLYRAETASITVNEGGSLTSAPLSVTVASASAAAFAIPTPASQTAGVGFTVSITAVDAYGNTANYTGSKCLAFSGPASSPGGTAPAYPAQGACSAGKSAVGFTAGVASGVGVTLYRAEAPALTATDGGISGSTGSFTVAAAAMASFSIPAPSPTAGVGFTLSITANDAYGNTANYAGSKCLAFSGPGSSPGGTAPAYPAQGGCSANQSAVSFTAGVAASVSVTLYRAETTTLTATDVSTAKTGATSAFTVAGGTLASFTIPTPASQTAGIAFPVSITAKDAYGNTGGYAGSQCLTFSGPASSPNGTAPTYPGSGTCGVGRSAVTFTAGVASSVSVTLYNAAPAALTVTDVPTGKAGSTAAFSVVGGAMSKLFLTAASTTPTIATTDSLTVRAGDAYGNTSASYTGSHTLTFAGASASGGYSPTVTNSSGTQIAFGSGTAITFASGVATVSGGSNGVMRLYRVGTAALTVSEGGNYTSAALSVTAGFPAGLAAKVQYRNHALADPYDANVIPDLILVNTGSSSVDLTLVTIRYWFTSDGGSTTYWTYCDYAFMGCSALSSSVTMLGQSRAGADAYFEVAFNAGAGSLAAAGSTSEIMVRFNKSDWSNFNETNDYSWAVPISSYVDSTKVTAYYYGNLLWGTEP